jgi:hypothetical protein
MYSERMCRSVTTTQNLKFGIRERKIIKCVYYTKNYNLHLLQWYTFVLLQTCGFAYSIVFLYVSQWSVQCFIVIVALTANASLILFPESQKCLHTE